MAAPVAVVRALAWRQRNGGSTAAAVRRRQYSDGSGGGSGVPAARVYKPAFVSHEAIRVEVKIPQTQGPISDGK